LQPLLDNRTADYEQELVYVGRSGGVVLRKVFYTAPSPAASVRYLRKGLEAEALGELGIE
jgi:hypothetical protein